MKKLNKKLYDAARYLKNKKKISAKNKEYRSKNEILVKTRQKNYRKANVALVRSWAASRRARLKKAQPGWLTSLDIKLMQQIYKKCPQGYQVDHIIPLNGQIVSGLHVPSNLQYLTKADNLRKLNKYEAA